MKKLGFGLMRLPLLDEEDRQSIDQEQVNRMADRYLEEGYNYFDTAYSYHNGMSEVAARLALVERHPRQSFLLADKMPTWMLNGPEDYSRIFTEQLERCGVDYFDYYLLHTLGEKNYASSLEYGGFEFLKQLKKEGKARKIGFSYHDKAELLDRILTHHPEMEFVQLQINYADWEDGTIQARQCYEVATKHGKPVIVMEPVKGGSLAKLPEAAARRLEEVHSDWSAAAWALRFTASLDNVMVVLSGMSSMGQMEENLHTFEELQPLTEEERKAIAEITGIINDSNAIPCTACRYCVDDCPKNIPIPQYFSLYNNQKQFGFVPAHANYYMNLAEVSGRASDCIACRMCERHCPQHLEVVSHLHEVASVFDR